MGGGGASLDFCYWASSNGTSWTQVPLHEHVMFRKELNRIGTLSGTFYDPDGTLGTHLAVDDYIRVTRTDSTDGTDGTIISDFIIRESDFDELTGISYEIKAFDLAIRLLDKVLLYSSSARTGDGAAADAHDIVDDYLTERGFSTAGSIDTASYTQNSVTLGAGKQIEYRAENDRLLDALADIARTVDCYWLVTGATDIEDITAAGHTATATYFHFVNPTNTAHFTLSAPAASHTLDKTELRRIINAEDGEAGNVGTVYVIGGGSGSNDGNRITGQWPASASGREIIHRDPAIQDATTATETAKAIFERENDANKPQKERGSAIRLEPRMYDSAFSATLGDKIKVEDSSGDLFEGTFWAYEYRQDSEEVEIVFNQGRDHFLHELREISRGARKYTDYAQVTDLDATAPATSGFEWDQSSGAVTVALDSLSVASGGGIQTLSTATSSMPADAPGYYIQLCLESDNLNDGPIDVEVIFTLGAPFSGDIIAQRITMGPFTETGHEYCIYTMYPFALSSDSDVTAVKARVINHSTETFTTDSDGGEVIVRAIEYTTDISHEHNTR